MTLSSRDTAFYFAGSAIIRMKQEIVGQFHLRPLSHKILHLRILSIPGDDIVDRTDSESHVRGNLPYVTALSAQFQHDQDLALIDFLRIGRLTLFAAFHLCFAGSALFLDRFFHELNNVIDLIEMVFVRDPEALYIDDLFRTLVDVGKFDALPEAEATCATILNN